MPQSTPFPSADVERAFNAFPAEIRAPLLALRELILATAASTPGVGRVEETLKWGEPAYLTPETKSGSTVRIGAVKGEPSQYALFVNCQTTLVETFHQTYPGLFAFDGSRAIVLGVDDDVPRAALGHCIALALRYHADKR